MNIEKATKNDLEEILTLQKIAYLSEARLLEDFNIQPLTQTLAEIEQEHKTGTILKLTNDSNNSIIGSVRAQIDKNTVYIGKLIVHPDVQNQGLGTKLLYAIEQFYPNMRYELFTSDLSIKNLTLYQKNSYRIFDHKKLNDKVNLVFLEKTEVTQN